MHMFRGGFFYWFSWAVRADETLAAFYLLGGRHGGWHMLQDWFADWFADWLGRTVGAHEALAFRRRRFACGFLTRRRLILEIGLRFLYLSRRGWCFFQCLCAAFHLTCLCARRDWFSILRLLDFDHPVGDPTVSERRLVTCRWAVVAHAEVKSRA